MSDVVVVGSLNLDLVVRAARLPAPGETVPGGVFATFRGGKGANQAVAAARMGAAVSMVGRVGDDAFGATLREGLTAEGIDVRGVRVTAGVASGVALITVDDAGQNTIVIAPGANGVLVPADVEESRPLLSGAKLLLLQLEVPVESVQAAARLAREHGLLVLLDPAPAAPLPAGLLALTDAVLPNEVEAAALTGIAITDLRAAAAAAAVLRRRGARRVLMKLGARGVWVDLGDRAFHVPGLAVSAVDTTAAGDAFAGALAAALVASASWEGAVGRANAAAALSTTRAGAQASMPSRDDVERFLSTSGIRSL